MNIDLFTFLTIFSYTWLGFWGGLTVFFGVVTFLTGSKMHINVQPWWLFTTLFAIACIIYSFVR